MQIVHLRPKAKEQVLHDLEVDSVALELDDQGNVTDFRLELGRGLEIVWLVPKEPSGYLRLIRIGYVTVDMDPEVLMDPCAVDFVHEWQGELPKVGGGRVVERCNVEMSQSGYRVTTVVSGTAYTLEYKER